MRGKPSPVAIASAEFSAEPSISRLRNIDRTMDAHEVSTLAQLRDLSRPPSEGAVRKELDRIDQRCRELVALSPFLVMASASSDGTCDASPKGGPPGFVAVLDEHRLLIPDAAGNRRLDGLTNMVENPRVGLVFLIPRTGETLRVNGRIKLTRDPALLESLMTGGRAAVLAILVEVEQAYIHCAKSVVRSGLWRSETWSELDEMPSAAQILSEHTGLGEVASTAADFADSYTRRL